MWAVKERHLVTVRHIKERVERECRTNVSLQFEETEVASVFTLSARGEMEIAILVEQMRREGFELLVSRPEVIYHRNGQGELLEPLETLYVDVPNENLGDILQSLAGRKGEVVNMSHHATPALVEAGMPRRGLSAVQTESGDLPRG